MEHRQDLEKAICKKYARITAIQPIGLIDTLRVLTGDDMLYLLKEYIDARSEKE